MMECLWWFLNLWSCRSGSRCGVWGFDWFKNVGLLLVFGFGIMGLQYGLQLSCLIRFSWGLIGKGCDLVRGICSKFDFGDFWDEKLWSCGKCLRGLSKISIVQLHVLQDLNHTNADSSVFFSDCDACGGDQSCDDDGRDGESGLFCDLEGHSGDCCYDCWCGDEDEDDDDLFWDCGDGDSAGRVGDEDEVFDVVALSEMIKSERQLADAAVVELEKERLAVASAAEEAMALILRLQNEKSVIEIEAHNYKKMAEQKMLFDQETIQSLRLLLLNHESKQRLLEDRLRLCRQKLKLYSQETEIHDLISAARKSRA